MVSSRITFLVDRPIIWLDFSLFKIWIWFVYTICSNLGTHLKLIEQDENNKNNKSKDKIMKEMDGLAIVPSTEESTIVTGIIYGFAI